MTKRFFHVNEGVVNFPDGRGRSAGQSVVIDEAEPLVGEVYGYDATRQSIFDRTYELATEGTIRDDGTLVRVNRTTAVWLLDIDTSDLEEGTLAAIAPGISGAISSASYIVLSDEGAGFAADIGVSSDGGAPTVVSAIEVAAAVVGQAVAGSAVEEPVAFDGTDQLVVAVTNVGQAAEGHGTLIVTIDL